MARNTQRESLGVIVRYAVDLLGVRIYSLFRCLSVVSLVVVHSSFATAQESPMNDLGNSKTVFRTPVELALVEDVEGIKAQFKAIARTNDAVATAISNLGSQDYAYSERWGKRVRRSVSAWRELREIGLPALYALINAAEYGGATDSPRDEFISKQIRELALGVIHEIVTEAGMQYELLPVFHRSLYDISASVRKSSVLRIGKTAKSMARGTHDNAYLACVKLLITASADEAKEVRYEAAKSLYVLGWDENLTEEQIRDFK